MTDNRQPEALRSAKYLTVVYRDIKPGDEARELIMHPKMTASSWSHVMNERDRLQAENANLNAGYAAARLEIESLRVDLRPDPGAYPVPQPASEYPALPEPDRVMEDWSIGGVLVDYFTTDQMRAYADATHALRASHGQAPAQQETFDHGPQATSIEEAARDVGKWLNERPNRPIDLRHVAMLCAHAQAAPAAVAGPSGDETQKLPGIVDKALNELAAFVKFLETVNGSWNSRTARDALRDIEWFARRKLAAAPTNQPAPQQEAQEPCPTCAALARTVMLDQVSFDRKPDCYGIRRITDDEGIEEWEDVRTSPDVAREEANDMMATGRGEIYEVVPLWTTPQPSPAPQADSVTAPAAGAVAGADWPTDAMIEAGRKVAATHGRLLGSGQSLWHVFREMFAAAPTPPAQTADSVLEDAAPTWRCQHCIDRHDGIYGSWAAPCPYHDDDGKLRIDAARAAQEGKSHG